MLSRSLTPENNAAWKANKRLGDSQKLAHKHSVKTIIISNNKRKDSIQSSN